MWEDEHLDKRDEENTKGAWSWLEGRVDHHIRHGRSQQLPIFRPSINIKNHFLNFECYKNSDFSRCPLHGQSELMPPYMVWAAGTPIWSWGSRSWSHGHRTFLFLLLCGSVDSSILRVSWQQSCNRRRGRTNFHWTKCLWFAKWPKSTRRRWRRPQGRELTYTVYSWKELGTM